MKKSSPYGRAPPRSKRQKLIAKGYREVDLRFMGYSSITESKARDIVKDYHKEGIPAQAVFVNPFGEGGHWTVMYKPIIGRK